MLGRMGHSHPTDVLCVTDPRAIDWSATQGVRALCVPDAAQDSHLGVICRIKGWTLFGDAGDVERPTTFVPSDTPLPADVQVSVFDADDIRATDSDGVGSWFVRWEHLLYRLPPTATRLTDALDATVPLVDELAAASGRPLVLRLPDVRSDDAALAHLFFDSREPNPALGVHGTRYLLAHEDVLAHLVRLAAQLPGTVHLAAPFVTSSAEFFVLTELVGDVPLQPFVETPMFLLDYGDYRELPAVGVGTKDLTYLLRGLDRENPRLARPEFLYVETVRHLRRAVTFLAEQGVRVAVTCTLEQYPTFARPLAGVDWTPSLPAAHARAARGGVSHGLAGS